MNVFVRSAGFLTSVQDLGRVGYRQSGVSMGGALDSHAMRVANALVNNEDDAAGLEATLGNLRLRFEDQRLVAWCGGAFDVRIGGRRSSAGSRRSHFARRRTGHDRAQGGARAWLAISGGIDVDPVLAADRPICVVVLVAMKDGHCAMATRYHSVGPFSCLPGQQEFSVIEELPTGPRHRPG